MLHLVQIKWVVKDVNMKIKDIISEGVGDELSGMDAMGGDPMDAAPPEMELSSKATDNKKIVNAILAVCDKLKGEGNSRVDLLPFITQVSERAGKVVKLADLIAVNKSSQEIQRIVDSIDEKSVKFKNTSVKNEDPAKAQQKDDATVGNMAGRASSRNRGL